MSDIPESETRLASLEARVQELEDQCLIRELLTRYGTAADQCRSEEFVRLFAEDGVLDVAIDTSWIEGTNSLEVLSASGDEGPVEDVIVRHEGHAALRQFITDGTNRKATEGMTLHFMDMNTVIRISGDAATTESYNITLVRSGHEIGILNAAINRWTLSRREGRWLIRECVRRRPGSPGFFRIAE